MYSFCSKTYKRGAPLNKFGESVLEAREIGFGELRARRVRKCELDDLYDVVHDGLVDLRGRARRGGLLVRRVQGEVQEGVEHLHVVLDERWSHLHEQEECAQAYHHCLQLLRRLCSLH